MEFLDLIGIHRGMSYSRAMLRLKVRGWSPSDAYAFLNYGMGKRVIRRKKRRR